MPRAWSHSILFFFYSCLRYLLLALMSSCIFRCNVHCLNMETFGFLLLLTWYFRNKFHHITLFFIKRSFFIACYHSFTHVTNKYCNMHYTKNKITIWVFCCHHLLLIAMQYWLMTYTAFVLNLLPSLFISRSLIFDITSHVEEIKHDCINSMAS